MWGTCGLHLLPYPTPSQVGGSAQDGGLEDGLDMLIWWRKARKRVFKLAVQMDVTIRGGGASHLLQAAAGLIGQGVRPGSLGREQGEAGADLTPGAAAGVGQPVGAALVEV